MLWVCTEAAESITEGAPSNFSIHCKCAKVCTYMIMHFHDQARSWPCTLMTMYVYDYVHALPCRFWPFWIMTMNNCTCSCTLIFLHARVQLCSYAKMYMYSDVHVLIKSCTCMCMIMFVQNDLALTNFAMYIVHSGCVKATLAYTQCVPQPL